MSGPNWSLVEEEDYEEVCVWHNCSFSPPTWAGCCWWGFEGIFSDLIKLFKYETGKARKQRFDQDGPFRFVTFIFGSQFYIFMMKWWIESTATLDNDNKNNVWNVHPLIMFSRRGSRRWMTGVMTVVHRNLSRWIDIAYENRQFTNFFFKKSWYFFPDEMRLLQRVLIGCKMEK